MKDVPVGCSGLVFPGVLCYPQGSEAKGATDCMKTLIVYYSMSGNTAHTAEELAKELGAQTLRIEAEKAYPTGGLKKFLWGGKSAVMAETPALRPYECDLAAFGCVVFGFPVWAANVAPPLRTFIRDNLDALRGKTFAAFACQSGSGGEKALLKLKACLGADRFAAETVLIDPLARPRAENSARLKAFCGALKAL